MQPVARSSNERVRRRRDILRRQGMRPLQIWIPDTRTPDLIAGAARQAAIVAAATPEEDLVWLDENADELAGER